jgi:branched-chain amino acid aminotransferase
LVDWLSRGGIRRATSAGGGKEDGVESTDYIWMNGDLIPWDEARIHVVNHTLHYGGGAFEGIRAYKTERGTAAFRLEEHLERLRYSCAALQIQLPFTPSELADATVELLRRNRLEEGYIRPLVYFGYGEMVLNPQGLPVETMIACWPWPAYLPHDMVDVKISTYVRIHPDSTVADAKICGHYVNSILATQEVAGSEFHEVRDGVVHTPKLGAILAGITRDTAIDLARFCGLEVVERDLFPEDALTADEAFFTGTAAEVTPIRSIERNIIGNGTVGPVTARLRDTYLDVVHGRLREFDCYLTYV